MPGKGKGGKGKGKGKGCLKYDWTVELEEPEAFDDLELYSYIYYDAMDGGTIYDEAYYDEVIIDPEALSGGVLEDKYESCGVACVNKTIVNYADFEFCWDNGLSESEVEDAVKRLKFEVAGETYEVDGDELVFADDAEFYCCYVGFDVADGEATLDEDNTECYD